MTQFSTVIHLIHSETETAGQKKAVKKLLGLSDLPKNVPNSVFL